MAVRSNGDPIVVSNGLRMILTELLEAGWDFVDREKIIIYGVIHRGHREGLLPGVSCQSADLPVTVSSGAGA